MEQPSELIDNWKQKRTGDSDAGPVFLWLVHVETRRYLDDEGGYCGAVKHYEFKNTQDAARRKDELLECFPFASVQIGHPDAPESAEYTSPRIGDFTKEKRRYLAWKTLGFIKRRLRPAPTLTVFDPAKDPSVKE